MNGPQHYREAEANLDDAARADSEGHHEDAMFWLVAAQVNATLALTAATADPFADTQWKADPDTDTQWKQVLR